MNYTIKIQEVNVIDLLTKGDDETEEQYLERRESLKKVKAFTAIAQDESTGLQIRAISDSFLSPDFVLPSFLKEFGSRIVEHDKAKPKLGRKPGECTCHESGKICSFCSSLTPEEFAIHSQRGPDGLEFFWTQLEEASL